MKKFKKCFLAVLMLALMVFAAGCGEVVYEAVVENGSDVAPERPSVEEGLIVIDSTQSDRETSEAASSEVASSEETSSEETSSEVTSAEAEVIQEEVLDPEGSYTSCEDVALYLETYGELPKNFMTKNEARELGWEGGSLEPYAPGMCIGGDKFGNYEGLLPKEKGRTYRECDIDTLGAKSRGAKRIVFSNDGLIYYTDDHYESFTLLYE